MDGPAGVQLPAGHSRPGGQQLGGQDSPSGADLQDSGVPNVQELDQRPRQGAAGEVMLAEGFP